jgi:hypothetical protein
VADSAAVNALLRTIVNPGLKSDRNRSRRLPAFQGDGPERVFRSTVSTVSRINVVITFVNAQTRG